MVFGGAVNRKIKTVNLRIYRETIEFYRSNCSFRCRLGLTLFICSLTLCFLSFFTSIILDIYLINLGRRTHWIVAYLFVASFIPLLISVLVAPGFIGAYCR